jgi:NitT/TauT family transport system substrate-binding protein
LPCRFWHYDYILQGLKEIPYGQWREFDLEDSVRFHALRMREVGMIQNTPQKIIDEHTDWRFFNELKRELRHDSRAIGPALPGRLSAYSFLC